MEIKNKKDHELASDPDEQKHRARLSPAEHREAEEKLSEKLRESAKQKRLRDAIQVNIWGEIINKIKPTTKYKNKQNYPL